eukprot:Nk52_evm9s225 gene=Nk52_evmTU9s225
MMRLTRASRLASVFATVANVLLIVTLSVSASPIERRAEGAGFAPKYINISFYDTMDGPVTGSMSIMNVCHFTYKQNGWVINMVSESKVYQCVLYNERDCHVQMKEPVNPQNCTQHDFFSTSLNKKAVDPSFGNDMDGPAVFNYTKISPTQIKFNVYEMTEDMTGKCQTKGLGQSLPIELSEEQCNPRGLFLHYDKETKLASVTEYSHNDCTGDYLSYSELLINSCTQTVALPRSATRPTFIGSGPYQQVTVSAPAEV